MKELTTVVARVLLALCFGIYGVIHFVYVDKMTAFVPAYLPSKVFWVYFTGLALIAGSIGLITKIQGKWAALGLATLMLIFILCVHGPLLADPAQARAQFGQCLKDLGLMAGALTWAGIFRRNEA